MPNASSLSSNEMIATLENGRVSPFLLPTLLELVTFTYEDLADQTGFKVQALRKRMTHDKAWNLLLEQVDEVPSNNTSGGKRPGAKQRLWQLKPERRSVVEAALARIEAKRAAVVHRIDSLPDLEIAERRMDQIVDSPQQVPAQRLSRLERVERKLAGAGAWLERQKQANPRVDIDAPLLTLGKLNRRLEGLKRLYFDQMADHLKNIDVATKIAMREPETVIKKAIAEQDASAHIALLLGHENTGITERISARVAGDEKDSIAIGERLKQFSSGLSNALSRILQDAVTLGKTRQDGLARDYLWTSIRLLKILRHNPHWLVRPEITGVARHIADGGDVPEPMRGPLLCVANGRSEGARELSIEGVDPRLMA